MDIANLLERSMPEAAAVSMICNRIGDELEAVRIYEEMSMVPGYILAQNIQYVDRYFKRMGNREPSKRDLYLDLRLAWQREIDVRAGALAFLRAVFFESIEAGALQPPLQ